MPSPRRAGECLSPRANEGTFESSTSAGARPGAALKSKQRSDLRVIETWGRRLLALVAMACFVLPLGRCSQVAGTLSTQPIEISGERDFVPAEEIEWVPINPGSVARDLLFVTAFFWPAAALLARRHAWSRFAQRTGAVVELLLSMYTLFCLQIWLGMYRDVRPAGYMALVTFGGLFVLACLRASREVRDWVRLRRLTGDAR